jgi:hypothetical protein
VGERNVAQPSNYYFNEYFPFFAYNFLTRLVCVNKTAAGNPAAEDLSESAST